MHAHHGPWLAARSSGVLVHLSSLPGPHGIGDLGRSARTLVDFLAECGFQYWQICPLGPTGYGDSPYQSFSSFAGNPYFIDLEELVGAGLLTAAECAPLHRLPRTHVDYGSLYTDFWPVLERAHARFEGNGGALDGRDSFEDFRARESAWLDPFAEFMAAKTHFCGSPWNEWPAEARTWRPGILDVLPDTARRIADLHRFAQYIFFGQWSRLRAHAASRGVRIIGDLPIFVALDSADTWRWRENFRFTEDGRPAAVAGVPPDYFSATGQLWGNPLYDWEHLERTGYAWWLMRLRSALALFDVIRLDHFRGFDTYWEIPGGSADARNGRWRNGPGLKFFQCMQSELPDARIIAEDLGYITADVAALRRAAGLPGMRILQFAYGHDDNNVNLPHFIPADSVVYTGTHDNDTTRGWLESLDPDTEARVSAYFQLDDSCSALPLVRAALASVARLAVVPLQDLLDLPGSARMNRPGTAEGNWQWRYSDRQLADLAAAHGSRFRAWNSMFDRTGDARQRDYSAPPATPTAHAGMAEAAAR